MTMRLLKFCPGWRGMLRFCRVRFSLRMLLLLVTAAACGLAWCANGVHQQMAAADNILAAGGQIDLDDVFTQGSTRLSPFR